MRALAEDHTATLPHCSDQICEDTGYLNMQTDLGFPISYKFLFLLPSNKGTETPVNEVNIQPQNLRAEKDLPNHRVQSPHFTGEKTPKRLNGMSKVTRLLNGVDGT